MSYPIITKREAEKILKTKEGKISLSMDLGRSLSEIIIKEGIINLNSQNIPISEFHNLKEDFFYTPEKNQLKKVAFFSEETNFYYKLFPTSDWPTLKLSSTPMHRHIKISPKHDTESKIKEISPVKGIVLDTCCGLGYTAIMAAKSAKEVHTFERDKYVLHIASFNPYSRGLFENEKIKVTNEDISQSISNFKEGYFDRIIHDPPTFKFSPQLYTKEFYRELYRVLKPHGLLYHYAPWPHKTKGNEFYKSIIKNLEEVGFKKIEYHDASSGIRAVKF